MDVVPKPDQVVSAAGNVAHRVLHGTVADLRPMPRTLVDDGAQRAVYHYRPRTAQTTGEPVLLVPPLAAPALCYDLRRGCSLVEHLVGRDTPTYLVDYGEVDFRNRELGIERWVDDIVPSAVRATSRHAGNLPVHLVGWSLGGLLALLAAAGENDLPIASITLLAAPVDTSLVPLVAPLRPLVNTTQARGLVTRTYQALGGAPAPAVRWAYQLSSFHRLVTKPLALATGLDDADFLAQVEAVDRFASQMQAYPGRTFGQLYHRFVRANALVDGELELDGRDLRLADVTAPVMVMAGTTDGIAPEPAVKALVGLLTGSEEVRYEIVPGGHLGMLTGRRARTTTWPTIDEWVQRWSTTDVVSGSAVKPSIGTSPKRRYDSRSSRSLAR